MTAYIEDPDVAAMLAVQRGDPTAFEGIVRRNQGRVLRLAYRFCGNRSTAEDMAQETFLRIYRNRNGYEPKARFTTFLTTVATRVCWNALRDASRRRTYAGGDRTETAILNASTPDRTAVAAVRNEEAVAVRAAVDALPGAQRIAILLHKWEDMSLEEIGEAMDLTPSAVKSLLFRARENLRGRLEVLE